ncbi:MAG TPA: zinc-binding dehydrogenase [Polyangia bacterium]|jgi:NADPH2:quinone reductase|nr:zinc-binding dehydrogenase [Polyangia bacterium]
MRAIVMREHGGPEVLRPEELPVPTPGRYQLLVRVHATSVNPVDTKVRRGGGAARAFPIVLGYDASGVVAARGPDVEGWSDQDEVFGCPNLFGPGANAEYVLLDARAAAKKPATLEHAAAACLPLVSLTAWEALHDRARLQPGQTVLIHAGAGGVGHVAIQLARLHGCRVITTAGRAASIAFCRDVLGADEVIDYHSVDFAARCEDLTGGRGVDVVLDTVGDETFRRSIDCVAPGGQLVTILAATPGDRAPILLYRSVSVHYEFMGARVANDLDPGHQGRILTSIARLVDRGLLRVHVGARFPLDQVGDAHHQIETGRTIGKLAVLVA